MNFFLNTSLKKYFIYNFVFIAFILSAAELIGRHYGWGQIQRPQTAGGLIFAIILLSSELSLINTLIVKIVRNLYKDKRLVLGKFSLLSGLGLGILLLGIFAKETASPIVDSRFILLAAPAFVLYWLVLLAIFRVFFRVSRRMR